VSRPQAGQVADQIRYTGLQDSGETMNGVGLRFLFTLLEMSNRFPIFIGFESPRANRFSQLRGKASTRPPNSLSSAAESPRERHTISISRRLRPGLRMTTSWP